MVRKSNVQPTQNGIQLVTTGFSLVWLLAANLVGLLLAAMLVWPEINRLLQPYTYGRWMPLHLDWQLYGWCSLPLLGVLCLNFFRQSETGGKTAFVCLSLWTTGLFLGGFLWLNGGSTGKIFLNWSGLSGLVFALAQAVIWCFLALAWIRSIRNRKTNKEPILSLAVKALSLLGLASVPFVLIHTSNPEIYPPVNPESGGATGHSLLLSTLSLVFLMGLLPGWILKLPTGDLKKLRRTSIYFWSLFGASLCVYLRIDHGNASNQTFNQIFGLGTLLIWPLLIHALWNRYAWSKRSAIWRLAFTFWWLLLAVDGWMIFLPGILDVAKFTNVLVGHSHLAMGGMVSALNFLILIEMGSVKRIGKMLSAWLPFILWNGGCLIYVVSMTLQGWREGSNPGVLFGFDSLTELAYLVRLIAGFAMVSANVIWVWKFACLFLSSREKAKVPPALYPNPESLVKHV